MVEDYLGHWLVEGLWSPEGSLAALDGCCSDWSADSPAVNKNIKY